MTKFFSIKFFSLLALSTGLLLNTACNKDDDDPAPNNERELITTVTLTFVDGNNISSVFKWTDPDGTGGNDPSIQTVTLKPNTSYRLFVAFLDESNPGDIKDITAEIRKESNDHLICLSGTGFTALGENPDTDDNGDPLGLESSLNTSNAGNGSLRVVLKHEANKSLVDPCNSGESDIDVNFPVTIQ